MEEVDIEKYVRGLLALGVIRVADVLEEWDKLLRDKEANMGQALKALKEWAKAAEGEAFEEVENE